MNEVKHIHIGRQQFTVSSDAYKELKEYLEAIAAQVGGEASDVAEEVEMRMAELLTERGVQGDKVILPADVAYLKEQLGEPQDFNDGSDTQRTAEPAEETKQLFRDTEHGMVAGVAAGLAAYLGIDAVIFRILFVVLTFVGGSGILIYVLFWLLVPEARTASDRLSMVGKPATVENLKRLVERADVPGAARRTGTQFGSVVRTLAHIILIVIGISLIAGGTFFFAGGTIALIYGLIHGAYVAGTKLFPVGGEQMGILISTVAAACLIATLLILLGVTVARRKRMVAGWIWAVLIGLAIVAMSVGGGLSFDTGAKIRHQYLALQHTRVVPVQAFQKLNFVGEEMFYDVEPGPTNAVYIRTLGNVDTQPIRINEQNGTLTIDTSRFHPANSCNFICPFGVTNTTIVVQTNSDLNALLPYPPSPKPLHIVPVPPKPY